MRKVTGRDGRDRVDGGSEWERRMSYSRAMRAGPLITIAGCVGIDEAGRYPDTASEQARCALGRVREGLLELGADLGHLVRIRIYTTCIDRWEEFAEVIGPALAESRPPNVLVEVAGLVDEAAMIEIEADAWVD
ncbi:MAG: Rid family hydrolase [Planctomycetota bacterium]|nr:Rid family hydrolase [Planctomycetota bacterium]MEC9157452.1 Rid family hydrolase [Planctomycetota bacterium]